MSKNSNPKFSDAIGSRTSIPALGPNKIIDDSDREELRGREQSKFFFEISEECCHEFEKRNDMDPLRRILFPEQCFKMVNKSDACSICNKYVYTYCSEHAVSWHQVFETKSNWRMAVPVSSSVVLFLLMFY